MIARLEIFTDEGRIAAICIYTDEASRNNLIGEHTFRGGADLDVVEAQDHVIWLCSDVYEQTGSA